MDCDSLVPINLLKIRDQYFFIQSTATFSYNTDNKSNIKVQCYKLIFVANGCNIWSPGHQWWRRNYVWRKKLSFVAQELSLGALTITRSRMAQKKWRTPYQIIFFINSILMALQCIGLCVFRTAEERQQINSARLTETRLTAKCHKTRSTFTSRQKYLSGYQNLRKFSSLIRKTWISLSCKTLGILNRLLKIREVLIPLKLEGREIAEQAKTK
jgi:hypothetical protein